MAFRIGSPAFAEGATIPRRHTCDGENVSPPLTWEDPPEATRSYVLLCSDPDAPGGTFTHWVAYDIPGEMRALDGGYGPESIDDGFRSAINDFGKPGYGGPCPPPGHGLHYYYFRFMALATDSLGLGPTATREEVEAAAEPYVIAQAECVGTYERAR